MDGADGSTVAPSAVRLPPPLESDATATVTSATAAQPQDEGAGVFEEWWFWTIVGAVVAGGVVAAVLLSTADDAIEDPMLGSTGVVSRAFR